MIKAVLKWGTYFLRVPLRNKYQYVQFKKIYTKTKRKAKITKGKGIHTLRHSFATHMYEYNPTMVFHGTIIARHAKP